MALLLTTHAVSDATAADAAPHAALHLRLRHQLDRGETGYGERASHARPAVPAHIDDGLDAE